MSAATQLAAVFALVATNVLAATPLQELDRTIRKEPEYQSAAVKYCLLVFGPEAKTRVWLALDGERLYVDRDADGDLTGPDERVTADPKWSRPERGVFQFDAGDIHDGPLTHKDLQIRIFQIDYLAESDEQVQAHLARDPSIRGYGIDLDVEMPGWQGNGLGGRVRQTVSLRDPEGLLQFGDSPQRAPVLHFRGPWQVTLYGPQTLRVGRETDLILGVGTPGVGPGATVFTSYENLMPESACPRVEIAYAPEDNGAAPFRERYELKQRC
jgi:hypothetical protein